MVPGTNKSRNTTKFGGTGTKASGTDTKSEFLWDIIARI